ncbi:MAG TPA: ribosome maturation factor RimM [Thermomicrobiales bacterium]|nr:ribosome maturation factor RimM [Thermomicrobiales bacterium]
MSGASVRRNRRQPQPRTLIESTGPEPTTPLEDVRLTIGRLAGPHGVQGEMKLRLLTDEPDHLIEVETVYLGDRDTPIHLEGIRFVNDGALISLEGVDTPEDAATLSGLPVKIAGTDARPLEEGEFFLYQLIGLTAYLEDGTKAGTVTDLVETGAYDVLVIADRPGASGDLMVPNHPDFVPEIDPAAGRLVIRPPEWDS